MLSRELDVIMSLLSEQEYRTAAYLANKIHASNKTVRNRIKALNDELKQYGAQVISKPRFGYILEVFDTDSFNEFKQQYQSVKESVSTDARIIPQTNEERAHFLLLYFADRKTC